MADEHPAAADVLEALIWEVRRLFREAASAADLALAPLGVSAGDRAVIESLAREPEPISLAELARKRPVSRQHIHQALGRLRNQQWVQRSIDPEDARSSLLSLSATGRSVWKEIHAIDKQLLRRVARQVDARKMHTAIETLRDVRTALEDQRLS